MKSVVIAILIVVIPLSGAIKSRSTFENWEGTLSEAGWIDTTGGNGDVLKKAEDGDPNSYQTQAHGKWSLDVYDPNNTSFANAYKTFSNSSYEYMVEFYIWIWSQSTASIDSFPLCVLYDTASGEKTDISLYLTTVSPTPPVENYYIIYLEDSSGVSDSVACIDSVDRWYKIQIYRHDGVVDFYLDGDLKGTYSPMHSNYVSNKIVLGTTAADSLSDGEVFYDDFVIVDYGDVNKMTVMKNMITKITSIVNMITALDSRSFRQYFTRNDIFEMSDLLNFLNTNFNNLSNYERLSYFNELVVKLDQIKLEFLYGNLNGRMVSNLES